MFQLFAKADESPPLIRPRKPLTFLPPNKEHLPVVLVDLSREPALTRNRILKFANETFNEHSPLVISPYLSKTLKHKLLRPKFEECLAEELQLKDVRNETLEDNRQKTSYVGDVQIIDAKFATKTEISTRMQKFEQWNSCARTRPIVGKRRTNPKMQTNNGFRKMTPSINYLRDLHCKVVEEKCINRLLQDMIIFIDREFPAQPKTPPPLTPPTPPVKYIKSLKERHIKQFLNNISKCLSCLQKMPSRAYEIRENDVKILRAIRKISHFLSRIEPFVRLPDFLISAFYNLYETVCSRIGKRVHWPSIPFVCNILHIFSKLPDELILVSRSRDVELTIRKNASKARARNPRQNMDFLPFSDAAVSALQEPATPFYASQGQSNDLLVDVASDPSDIANSMRTYPHPESSQVFVYGNPANHESMLMEGSLTNPNTMYDQPAYEPQMYQHSVYDNFIHNGSLHFVNDGFGGVVQHHDSFSPYSELDMAFQINSEFLFSSSANSFRNNMGNQENLS
ncbi:unnamed protein product [Auanema sp. JU1783]|nr:unnamed protein product [Auanema sp. JU1783]